MCGNLTSDRSMQPEPIRQMQPKRQIVFGGTTKIRRSGGSAVERRIAGFQVTIKVRVSRTRERTLGRYSKGDHVKIEVRHSSGECEWMWLLVESSDDRQRLVFGKLDQQPVVNTDMLVGQHLAVSYDNVRDHQRFDTQSAATNTQI